MWILNVLSNKWDVHYLSLLLVKASATPALPQEFLWTHLLKANINLETEIRPR